MPGDRARLWDSDGGVWLLQRVWNAAVAVEPLHRDRGDLYFAFTERMTRRWCLKMEIRAGTSRT